MFISKAVMMASKGIKVVRFVRGQPYFLVAYKDAVMIKDKTGTIVNITIDDVLTSTWEAVEGEVEPEKKA